MLRRDGVDMEGTVKGNVEEREIRESSVVLRRDYVSM